MIIPQILNHDKPKEMLLYGGLRRIEYEANGQEIQEKESGYCGLWL